MNAKPDFYMAAEELFQQYFQREYQQALETANRLAADYPEKAVTTYFWRICLTSRLGQTAGALEIMQQAMSEGFWWSEWQLRQDPDLEGLQGLPEFEQLVNLCSERHAEAQSAARPELFVRVPEGSGPFPLLIALHGRGSSAAAESRHWEQALGLGWLVALPQSSQLAWPGSFAWDHKEIAEREILAHYNQLLRDYPIERSRVVVAGFSQGAALAIRLVMSASIAARGFLAVVPGTIAAEELDFMARLSQGSRLKGYLVAGGRDQRYQSFLQMREILSRYRIPCEIEAHPDMAHEFPPDFDQTLRRALNYLTD